MRLSICSAEANPFKDLEQHGSIVLGLIDSSYKNIGGLDG